MIYDEAAAKRCLTTTLWLVVGHQSELAKLVADRG